MGDLPGYDAWKTRSDRDDDVEEECPVCGGEGYVFDCFDGCCEDADVGCEDCTRRCECNPRRKTEAA